MTHDIERKMLEFTQGLRRAHTSVLMGFNDEEVGHWLRNCGLTTSDLRMLLESLDNVLSYTWSEAEGTKGCHQSGPIL